MRGGRRGKRRRIQRRSMNIDEVEKRKMQRKYREIKEVRKETRKQGGGIHEEEIRKEREYQRVKKKKREIKLWKRRRR